MLKLSIVIAAVDGVERLESGLVSVLQHRPSHSEVLVILPQSYADPYDLKDEVCFIEARRGAGLIECLNLGWQASTGPIVHFLASGLEVAADWADEAARHFANPRIAAVAPLMLWGTDTAESTYSSGVTYSSGGAVGVCNPPTGIGSQRGAILGPHLEAGFFRKAALESIGGLATNLGERLPAVDAALALRQVGYQAILEPASRVAVPWNPPQYTNGFSHGLYSERLFWRNAASQGWIRSLAAHPLSVINEAMRLRPRGALVTGCLGRLVACCQSGQLGRRREQLRALAAALALSERVEQAAPAAQDDADFGHLRFDPAHTPSRGKGRARQVEQVGGARKSA